MTEPRWRLEKAAEDVPWCIAGTEGRGVYLIYGDPARDDSTARLIVELLNKADPA